MSEPSQRGESGGETGLSTGCRKLAKWCKRHVRSQKTRNLLLALSSHDIPKQTAVGAATSSRDRIRGVRWSSGWSGKAVSSGICRVPVLLPLG